MHSSRWKATLVVLLLAATALTDELDLSSHTVDGGGGYSVGGGFELSGTIGQSDAGPGAAGMTGGDFVFVGGFWPGATAPAAGRTCPDLDGNGSVDQSDFSLFEQCFAGPSLPSAAGCPAGVDADCDGDSDVDLADFALFAQQFVSASRLRQ